MTEKVFLRCAFCGNAMRVERERSDPPGTVHVVTNECDICNAASGGFEHVEYFDRKGRQIRPETALEDGSRVYVDTAHLSKSTPVDHIEELKPEFSTAVLKAMARFNAKLALEDKIARMAWDRFAPEHEIDFDECAHKAEYLRFAADVLAKTALPADLEARAHAAEAKVAAAEERGLVFNMLPNGRLDFCAIREGSRLWDGRVRAEALAAEVAGLREALADLLSWFDGGPSSYGPWIIKAGEYGADDAVRAACEALAAAPAAPVIPRLNIRCETTDGHVTGSTYLNVIRVEAEDDGSFTAVTDHWPSAPAALARKMGGGDAE